MLRGRDNPILKETIAFSLLLINYVEELETARKFVIARQLLRAGTSIGANVHEAQHAESIQDFIHKFKIAAKEAEETAYWLVLCAESPSYPQSDVLKEKLIVIAKIIARIIKSSRLRSQAESSNH